MVKVSEIQEVIDMKNFLEDDAFEQAIDQAVNAITNPFVPKEKVAALVIQFEAYAMLFDTKAKNYMYVNKGEAGSDSNKKKNIYMGLVERCHEMSNALKILVRV